MVISLESGRLTRFRSARAFAQCADAIAVMQLADGVGEAIGILRLPRQIRTRDAHSVV